MTSGGLGHAGCPECGAAIDATARKCWLCGKSFATAGTSVETPVEALGVSTEHPLPQPVRATFSITTMLLVITLVAVVLGIARVSIGLGIVTAVIVTPAFIRAAWIAAREKAAGQRPTLGEKLVLFLASLGVVLAIGLAAGGAFFAACFGGGFGALFLGEAVGFGDYGFAFFCLFLGVGLGGIAALVSGFFMIRLFWRRGKTRHD